MFDGVDRYAKFRLCDFYTKNNIMVVRVRELGSDKLLIPR